jgi:hypothetical protein
MPEDVVGDKAIPLGCAVGLIGDRGGAEKLARTPRVSTFFLFPLLAAGGESLGGKFDAELV